MSGASSNSSMLNHGGSPAVHRHVVNANSSLSTTPLASHHHGSSSGSLTGHSVTVNHHHVSSGISCESSSSNANTRTHSRLDHVHDHHHHLQQVHSLHPSHPDARQRDRAPSSLEHHGHHHGHVHTHGGHQHPQNNDTKNASIIGVDSIQVSFLSKFPDFSPIRPDSCHAKFRSRDLIVPAPDNCPLITRPPTPRQLIIRTR